MGMSIKQSLEKYPDFITPEHLVALGVFKNLDAAYHARARGESPPWIKLKHKIIHSRQDVADFLEDRLQKTKSEEHKTGEEQR